MEPSGERGDIEPIVPFDAIGGERRIGLVWVVLALGLGIGVLWYVGAAWIVGQSLGFIVCAVLFAWRRARARSHECSLFSTEAMSVVVAFAYAVAAAAMFGALQFHFGLIAGASGRMRAEAVAAALFALGCAVAFVVRRGTCAAGQAAHAPLDAVVAAPLVAATIGNFGARRVLWAAFGATVLVAAIRFALPQWSWLGDPLVFAVPIALGWFGGRVVACAIAVGAIVARVAPGLETPSHRSLVPIAAFAVIAGGGLGALIRHFGELRQAHDRLGGDERIRLEIGGLGTRLERMTPRTQRQISVSSCVMLCALATLAIYLVLRRDSGIGCPSVVTALVVGVGVLCALGAVFATQRTGAGLVASVTGFAFSVPWIRAGFPELLPWGAEYDAFNVAAAFAPCAIVGAALATHVQQVGARIGATPLRSQRLVLLSAACGFACVLGATLWLHTEPTKIEAFPGSLVGDLSHRYGIDDGDGATAYAGGTAFFVGLAGQLLALPAVVAALGLLIGLRTAALVVLGAVLASWARARGTAPVLARGIGVAIALAEIATYAVFGLAR